MKTNIILTIAFMFSFSISANALTYIVCAQDWRDGSISPDDACRTACSIQGGSAVSAGCSDADRAQSGGCSSTQCVCQCYRETEEEAKTRILNDIKRNLF